MAGEHERSDDLHFVPQVVKNSDILFLAVKPQYIRTVLKESRQHLTDKHVIVSIAAGIPLEVLQVLSLRH